MSFVQMPDGQSLVRDTFPEHVARVAQDTEEFHSMELRKVVPIDYETIVEWAFVAVIEGSLDLSRQFSLQYYPLEGELETRKVSIRALGFLGDFNLQSTGNWNGSLSKACKATNFLTLEPGPFIEQFAALQNAISHLKTLIHRSLYSGGQDLPPVESVRNQIFCQRRIFTKVSGMYPKPESLLSPTDPLASVATMLSDIWRVTDRIRFGVRLASGTVAPATHLIFDKGNFVDVLLSFDIATVRHSRDGVPVTVVHLCPEHLIQLCPARRVPETLISPSLGQIPPNPADQLLDSAMIFGNPDPESTEEMT